MFLADDGLNRCGSGLLWVIVSGAESRNGLLEWRMLRQGGAWSRVMYLAKVPMVYDSGKWGVD